MEASKNTNKSLIITLVGIIFVAANLRAPITSVGPVIKEISTQLGLNKVSSGLVTTIPLLSFALLSGFAPKLSNKYGIEKVMLYALLVLAVGILLRPIGNISFLFIGAALVGAAITMGNVLMPAFIKDKFPNKVGLVTGTYSVSMNLVGALAAGYSIVLGQFTGFGWKGSIGIWAVLCLVSFVVWLPQVINAKRKASINNNTTANNSFSSLLKSPLAWCITIFMGLQSCLFYSLVAWLPTILQDWGMSADRSGWILSYVQLSQLPVTFIGPVLAVKMKNQSLLVWITTLFLFAGLAGIIFFKTTYIVLSVVLIGMAGGLAFSLAMMFFVLRTETTARSAQLSGMAQSFGYLIAACSPPLFGAIFDITHNWLYPLLLLAVVGVVLLIVGLVSAKPNFVK